ncbi:transposase [Bradyrhizobium valentinum]|nr:transposase [Bradyrhizobium valentinum]
MDTCSRLGEPGEVLDVASSGRSIGSVAKELGLRDSVLRRWVELRGAGRDPTAAARRPTTQAPLPSADHAAELARLQRENERLRMERDILKARTFLHRAP